MYYDGKGEIFRLSENVKKVKLVQVIESKKYFYSLQLIHNKTVDNTSRVRDLWIVKGIISVRQNNLMF